MPKITTRCICPPIPIRTHDWMAFYDDDGEEAGRYGYGATEDEAIADLTENYEYEHGQFGVGA